MASGMNVVVLAGNLGKDPEVRYSQSGTGVCNLRLAVTERRKQGEEWKDHTEWVDVVVFGKNGENCGQYLHKGAQVTVHGRLQTRKWQDKEGKDRYSTEVVADEVVFPSKSSGIAGAPVKTPDDPKPQPSAGFIDHDLPF